MQGVGFQAVHVRFRAQLNLARVELLARGRTSEHARSLRQLPDHETPSEGCEKVRDRKPDREHGAVQDQLVQLVVRVVEQAGSAGYVIGLATEPSRSAASLPQ